MKHLDKRTRKEIDSMMNYIETNNNNNNERIGEEGTMHYDNSSTIIDLHSSDVRAAWGKDTDTSVLATELAIREANRTKPTVLGKVWDTNSGTAVHSDGAEANRTTKAKHQIHTIASNALAQSKAIEISRMAVTRR